MAEGPPELVPGLQISKGVSLLKPLSSGGMGAVWLADHLGLKTHVVVKFMLEGMDTSDQARTRFSREAAAAAQVKSPHVVQMFDHGLSDGGIPFIVMEHLEGHDLGKEIETRGALPPEMVVAVVGQVAKALSKVHAAGLLHRDIKPDNIFLVAGEEDVFVKLLDFGIAKSSTAEQADGALDGQTKTGQVVGTPFYMSPEQVTAQKTIDHRSDLWALGVVAYEALTGQRPYDGPSFGALAVKIATGTPVRPTLANPALPTSIDAWFEKACSREPTQRFASAKEMAEGLRAAFEGVVSLPRSYADSGRRSGPAHRSTDPNAPTLSGDSGPQTPSPEMGLAATALDDSDASRKRAALAQSEAGMSVGGEPRAAGQKSFGRFVALGMGVVAGAAVFLFLRGKPGAPAHMVKTPPPPVTFAVSAPTPNRSEEPSAVHPAIGSDAGTSAATSAGPTASIPALTSATPGVHTGAASPRHPHASPKPSASEAPTKSTKPTSTEPDLY